MPLANGGMKYYGANDPLLFFLLQYLIPLLLGVGTVRFLISSCEISGWCGGGAGQMRLSMIRLEW